MALPITLSSLNVREAIADALYRGIDGVDTNDATLFRSSMTDDVCFDLRGNATNGLEDVTQNILGFVGPMDTTHNVSNLRIDVNAELDKASLSAHAICQHCRPGEGIDTKSPKYTTGVMYFMDLVKSTEDGLWKAKKWTVKYIWAEGDETIMKRE
ncbi:NTF2 [Fusarium albosuccineum]|uniref:NTF2 n=1 Tax=Fusarium albosuccineum TaxID=1237068 RepID=A0A8H4KT06_9HYPO|nr:NTF2 [Fusarium albosuccineum]